MSKKGMLMTSDLAEKTHKRLKTVTRRIIKPQPPEGERAVTETVVDGRMSWCFEARLPNGEWDFWYARAPYQPGDIVSIKETHWRWGIYVPWRNKAGNLSRRFVNNHYPPDKVHIRFDEPEHKAANVRCIGYHKRSPLFLPYDLARTHVEILDVRPELLQAITYADCLAEGISEKGAYNDYGAGGKVRDSFAELWDSINGKKHPWANNDWVWRYSFRKVENDAKN